MKNNDFKSLYKKLIEYHGLSPKKAKEILRGILTILNKNKEGKK